MAAVRWSRWAETRLERISPVTRDQLVSSAGKILHDITSADFPHDEGYAGEIMWHRGIPCGILSEELLAESEELLADEDDDGPWNYFLFYRALPPAAEEPDPYQTFEVLDVRSVAEVARRWKGGG
jgi:hypothetical protein